MAVPDAVTTLALRGVPLNDCWKVGDQLPTDKQNGATIYLVYDKSDLPVEDLEAHAFVLDDTQPKIRKHRLRCIKRMTHRTKLEVNVQNILLIIIDTSLAIDKRASEQRETIDGPAAMKSGPKADRKGAAKTPYNRESARIRQRERRQARRSERAKEHDDTVDTEKEITKSITLDDSMSEFTAIMITLWMLYDETGTLRETMPIKRHGLGMKISNDSLYDAAEKYLKHTTIELESPADVESYLEVKRGEMISLRRQLARVPNAEKYHRDKLDALSQANVPYGEHLPKWQEQELEIAAKPEANLQLQLVVHARIVLPKILASRRSHIRFIEQKCTRALERLAPAERNAPCDKSSRDVTRYEAWTHTVFPLSDACASLLRQLGKATFRLVIFGTFFQPGTMYEVESTGTGETRDVDIRSGRIWLEFNCRPYRPSVGCRDGHDEPSRYLSLFSSPEADCYIQ